MVGWLVVTFLRIIPSLWNFFSGKLFGRTEIKGECSEGKIIANPLKIMTYFCRS